jgi:hypothetical protein
MTYRILLQLGVRLQQSLKHDDSSTGTGRGRRKCDDKPITKVELQQGWDYDFNSLSNRMIPQQACKRTGTSTGMWDVNVETRRQAVFTEGTSTLAYVLSQSERQDPRELRRGLV